VLSKRRWTRGDMVAFIYLITGRFILSIILRMETGKGDVENPYSPVLLTLLVLIHNYNDQGAWNDSDFESKRVKSSKGRLVNRNNENRSKRKGIIIKERRSK
jgi:hypothetical protein